MRVDLHRTSLSVLGGVLLTGPATAAEIHYTVAIPDPSAGVVEVTATVEDYPYPEASVILADPPRDATTYFTFFTDESFTHGRDDEALLPERTGVGMADLTGIDGRFTVRFTVLVEELVGALGTNAHMPTLSETHTVLPLRSILPDLVEIEDRGLAFQAMTVELDFPSDWGILTPWRTYDRQISFAEVGYDKLRSGIVCAGDFHIVNGLDERPPWLGLYHGSDESIAQALDTRVRALMREHTISFSTRGQTAFTVIAEFGDGPVDVRSYGEFLRILCPPSYPLATPDELAHGTDAFDFHRRLSHEAFHHWMGASGIVTPLSPGIYWLSEGAADYLGAVALSRAGIVTPEAVLDYLGHLATRLRERDDRAEPVDQADGYLDDADYRELVLQKGPIIAAYLDFVLLRSREENGSLETALRHMLYKSFLQDRRLGAYFSEIPLAESMEEVMGLRGKFVLSGSIRGDVYAEAMALAPEVGLRWIEEGDEVRLETEPGGHMATRLTPRVAD